MPARFPGRALDLGRDHFDNDIVMTAMAYFPMDVRHSSG